MELLDQCDNYLAWLRQHKVAHPEHPAEHFPGEEEADDEQDR
jgi:hypothetical protein